jgi:hypothetical protein
VFNINMKGHNSSEKLTLASGVNNLHGSNLLSWNIPRLHLLSKGSYDCVSAGQIWSQAPCYLASPALEYLSVRFTFTKYKVLVYFRPPMAVANS